MKKENFKTIIQIKQMVKPSESKETTITEIKYNRNTQIKKTFEYISFYQKIMCLDKKKALKEIGGDTYIPNKKDKLFFGANCTIPRHKVREWGKKHNISITVKPEKANVNVISNNWVSSLFGYWGSYYNILLDKNNFIEYLELNYANKVDDLIKAIKDSESDKVLISRSDHRELMGHKQLHYGKKIYTPQELIDIKKENGIISSYCEMFDDKEYTKKNKEGRSTNYEWDILDDSTKKEQDLNKIFNLSDTVTTILDTTLIDIVNESSITIDNEMSDQLKSMLHSTDNKNHVLAMEIIANCNYRTSLHKILLIFKDYGNTVWNRPERNHVNFKSLVKFIDLYHWYNPSYDSIINCLMKKKYLTGDILSEFMPLVKEEIEREASHVHSIFKVNTITVSNDVKRYFGLEVEYSKEELELLEEIKKDE